MLKRTEEKIQGWIRDFYKDFISAHESRYYHNKQYYRTCETCGCLIDSKKAVKGVSFVKSTEELQVVIGYPSWIKIEEEIYTPYYCLIHAPIINEKVAPKDKKSEYNHKFEKATQELYHELIMEVLNKVPGESRHETALRYIRERENISRFGGNCATKSTHHETGREEDV